MNFPSLKNYAKKNPDFAGLKLVYTSKQLPSSPLVSVGKNDETTLSKVKKTLKAMSGSLKGNLILKKLRLKGFAEL